MQNRFDNPFNEKHDQQKEVTSPNSSSIVDTRNLSGKNTIDYSKQNKNLARLDELAQLGFENGFNSLSTEILIRKTIKCKEHLSKINSIITNITNNPRKYDSETARSNPTQARQLFLGLKSAIQKEEAGEIKECCQKLISNRLANPHIEKGIELLLSDQKLDGNHSEVHYFEQTEAIDKSKAVLDCIKKREEAYKNIQERYKDNMTPIEEWKDLPLYEQEDSFFEEKPMGYVHATMWIPKYGNEKKPFYEFIFNSKQKKIIVLKAFKDKDKNIHIPGNYPAYNDYIMGYMYEKVLLKELLSNKKKDNNILHQNFKVQTIIDDNVINKEMGKAVCNYINSYYSSLSFNKGNKEYSSLASTLLYKRILHFLNDYKDMLGDKELASIIAHRGGTGTILTYVQYNIVDKQNEQQ